MIRHGLLRFCALLIFLTPVAHAQTPLALIRTPALSPDGSNIAFSIQGDIWTVPSEGGVATRLTIHEGHDASPIWSPDGDRIAFQSSRYGHEDIFVMGASGTTPERLTFRSGADQLASWSTDGRLLFTSARAFQQVEWDPEIQEISVNGGTPHRLLDAFGHHPVASPNGRFIVFYRGSSPVVRERYTGPANLDLWLFDSQDGSYSQLTTFEGQDYLPDWGDDQTLFYLSANGGQYTVHMLTIDDTGAVIGNPERVVGIDGEGIRAFDASADGQTLILEQGEDIWRYRIGENEPPARIAVTFPGDYRYDPVEQLTHTDGATEFDISPNGENIAFVVRGDVFVTRSDKEKNRSVGVGMHPFREQEVEWLSDSTLVFISDRDGQKDIYLAKSTDSRTGDLYRSLKQEVTRLTNTPEDESELAVSPDRKKLAWSRGYGTLIVADLDNGERLAEETTLLDGWAAPSDISWSPDSRWLAYSKSDLDFNEEVFIHAADNSQTPVNVTLHPRVDSSPLWSADGGKLGFLSTRNNGDSDAWFVWLRKADWEKTQQDWEETEDDSAGKKNDKDSTATIEPVGIDFDNIHKRLVQVSNLPGNESGLQISSDGERFFYLTNAPGRQESGGSRDLIGVNWDGSEELVLASDLSSPGSLKFGPDGKKLYLRHSGGQLAAVPVDGGSVESLSFRAVQRVDHIAERSQIFDEAWKVLDQGFYDPKFHGQDWNSLKQYYRRLALATSSQRDFRDIFNRMLGQLNASHMGLRGGDRERTQDEQSGLLGIDVKPHGSGIEVVRVVEGGPASRAASRLETGDIIRSVDGEALTPETNLYATLVGKVNERVLLEVESSDGVSREVVIRPAGSLNTALYEEWVEERKRLTETYSGGRLGYLHVEGMNWPSFERFERELTASGYGKEGLVIDVRYNGGGWTTDMLMTVLSVRQHAYTIPRGASDDLDRDHLNFREHYPFGERLPLSAWTKPSVALCNENSYSNAEIFSHAYKTLDIGTLVGQPTFGAVISTGGQGLLDGSMVRLPFRAWYVKATETNMENGPAVPDVLAVNPPDYRATGEDAQLKKAVEVLLREIDG